MRQGAPAPQRVPAPQSRIASNTSIEATCGAGGERESWRGILLRLKDKVAAHGAGLALHLGAERLVAHLPAMPVSIWKW